MKNHTVLKKSKICYNDIEILSRYHFLFKRGGKMTKYKALKDYPSTQLNRMVKEGEVVDLDYTYEEILQHFGKDFVEPVKKTVKKRSEKVDEENE